MSCPILKQNGAFLSGGQHAAQAGLRLDDALYGSLRVEKASLDGIFLCGDDPSSGRVIGSRVSEGRFVERQLKGVEFEKAALHFCFGFGTGLKIRRMLERMPASSRLMCIEPRPEVVFKLLGEVDLSGIATDQRFSLVLVRDVEKLEELLDPILGDLNRFDKVRFCPVEESYLPESFRPDQWRSRVQETLRFRLQVTASNIGTFKNNAMNLYRNALISLQHHDWPAMLDQLRGRPLVVLSAGPTLAAEMDSVRAVQDRVYVGCVDAMLREVMDSGIVPDLVFQVTWNPRSEAFFHKLEIPRSAVLVHSTLANAVVLKSWPGQRLSWSQELERILLDDLIRPHQPPIIGVNVGHFAVQFGVVCGASPVFLVGQDNAFPTMSFYHPGAVDFLILHASASRFWSAEKAGYEHSVSVPNSLEVENQEGETVRTMKPWLRLREPIGNYVAANAAGRAMHYTSRHSLAFPGMTHRTLASYAGAEGASLPPKAPLRLNDTLPDRRRLGEFCDGRLRDLRRFSQLLDDGVLRVKDLESALSDPGRQEAVPFLTREFQKSMRAFFDFDAKWLLPAVMEIEKSLGAWMETEKSRLKDAMTEQDAQQRIGREFLLRFHERSGEVRVLLANFYTSLKEKAAQA